jgi:hypothetical protein
MRGDVRVKIVNAHSTSPGEATGAAPVEPAHGLPPAPPTRRRRFAWASKRLRLSGVLGPGTYRLRVTGGGATAYEIGVRLAPVTLQPDAFEPNDSLDRGAPLLFHASQRSGYARLGRRWSSMRGRNPPEVDGWRWLRATFRQAMARADSR